jgi:cell wall-associated NlpC family hydrolase
MKGICNLAVVPLRKTPESTSEIVSQLLFGDTFTINKIEKNWVNITTLNDNYSGYISDKQYCTYENDTENWIVNTNYPYLEAITQEGKLLLPAGCLIPPQNKTIIGQQEITVTNHPQLKKVDSLTAIAMQYLNVPYLWGGKTPFGIDCSGFMQMVFKQCGVQLPRDAYQQAELGKTLDFVNECKCGDLAFFDNADGKITHVGLMLDHEKIIHASGKVRIDLLDHYGILNTEENYYSHKLRIIKRIL